MTLPPRASKHRHELWLRYWLPVLAWMGAIPVAPHLLGSSVPSSPTLRDQLIRSAIHAAEYAILALLVLRALGARRDGCRSSPKDQDRTRSLIALSVAVLYGVLDELTQGLLPNRQLSLLDVLADAFGSLTALAVVEWLRD